MDKIKQFKHYRNVCIADMSALVSLADQATKEKSRRTLFKVRCADIQELYDEFMKQHQALVKILLGGDADADVESEKIIRQAFLDDFYVVKATYTELFENANTGILNNTMMGPAPTSAGNSNLRLPLIELSKFEGDYKTFITFLDQFNAMVHNNSTLSNIEKFNYLLTSLKGPPASLVRTLPLSSDNYPIAYKTLVERYLNNRLRSQAHWSAIESVPKADRDNSSSLRNLLDVFSENLAALKVMNYPVDQWDFILTMMMLKKLDNTTGMRFEMEHRSSDMPTYEELKKFLNTECMVLDTLQSSPANNRISRTAPQKPHSGASRTTNLFVNKPPARSPAHSCIFCNADHALYYCPAFTAKSPSERHHFCKTRRLCFNCLSSAHDLKSCRSTYKCKRCHSRYHHTLLCSKNQASGSADAGAARIATPSNAPAASELNTTENTSNSNSNSFLAASGVVPLKQSILLATAWIDICNNRGQYQPIRCLLDSGSMISFITQRAVSKLGLRKSAISIEVRGLGSMRSQANKGLVQLSLKPLSKESPLMFTEAVILDKICEPLPAHSLPQTRWSHIQNLNLADPTYYKPGNIDMLLGADIFSKILLNESLSGNANTPTAISTILGYILMGNIEAPAYPSVSSLFCNPSEECSLETTIKQFWEVEGVPQTECQDPEHIVCEKIFLETYSRDNSGKFTVSLPFREKNPSFPGMRNYALSRFHSLERRLGKHPEIYAQYSEFMRECLQLNHMEFVENADASDHSYYLVHHCVLKPESTSTKLRVVFNASAKIAQQKSLNDCLMAGPKLQQDICHILLNFRLFPYVLCSDVAKMYRMIWVDPKQRDYQRILWRFSPAEEVKDYRLLTLPYGLTSSPFLALKCVLQLCIEEGEKYPLATEIIRNFSYIDDFVFSVPTVKEAYETRTQLISLMRKGGFELRKWSSNEPSLIADLPESYLSKKPLDFHSDSNESSLKVLGLQWNPTLDSFSFNVNPRDTKTCTKRVILSELARVYDPLGFISPVTFFTKHLIQRLWTAGIGWDDCPPNEIVLIWQQYLSELQLLSQLRLPRLMIPKDSTNYELHGFCDSSEKGYACVIYVRTARDNQIHTNFVCAKSKVASHSQKLTIARLELCAMVLLAKLMMFVLKSIDEKIKFCDIYAWSDSQIALHWIKGSPHRWKTFVANRVSFIQEHIPFISWHYIDSKNNPADLASRGASPSTLLANECWFTGPSFLRELILPCSPVMPKVDYPVEEERKLVLFATSSMENVVENLLNNQSAFVTIQRICAYMLRFVFNSRNPTCNRTGPLNVSELHDALLLLVKFTQQVHFAQEFDSVCFSRPLRKLAVFLDDRGILRIGGRLKHANLPYNAKHPILLPRQSRLTTLLIEFYHKKYFHCGFRSTHFLISQTFWILSPKRAINSILSKCIRCWKQNPKHFQPPMASLPVSRISEVKPFLHSGVDFGGPFLVTPSRHRGVRTSKAYLCIFVCFTTKAVHLELASDLSSPTFLSALQRFIARRGRVSHLYCDNATNFVGSSRELKLMQTAAEQEIITFKFSPPSGPHFNGLAEAGVKSVKLHLAKVVGDQIMTYEELYTVLTLIESILNSRPLTPFSSDMEDINALTPAHFLTLEPVGALPVPDYTSVALTRLSRFELIQRIQTDFWKRFKREYLQTLQQRGKWLDPASPPETGSLVLIKDGNSPPCKWNMGRISALHPGDDNISRVATVKTSSGELKRPLVKLCPLPTC